MLMRIRELREVQRMTQEQLGTQMGVSQNAISQWETEQSLPKTKQLPQLADVLNCQINDLFRQEAG